MSNGPKPRLLQRVCTMPTVRLDADLCAARADGIRMAPELAAQLGQAHAVKAVAQNLIVLWRPKVTGAAALVRHDQDHLQASHQASQTPTAQSHQSSGSIIPVLHL